MYLKALKYEARIEVELVGRDDVQVLKYAHYIVEI